MLNNSNLTFKELKDVFNAVFGSYIVQVSKEVPMASAYVTCKDGDFYVASAGKPNELLKVTALKKAAKLDECDYEAAESTVNDIISVLQTIDPVLMNRYFANGKNLLKVSLVCPPNGCSDNYGKKCFLVFDGIDCLGENDEVAGRDEKAGLELFKILKANGKLGLVPVGLEASKLDALKRCHSEKKVLSSLVAAMQKLIDGLGWGCTIGDYIQDRYSRLVINKALEHGLDVSKNGSFVKELVSRLSGLEGTRPTKSDLVTFAKREGIDCGSDCYKSFLDDVEQSAS